MIDVVIEKPIDKIRFPNATKETRRQLKRLLKDMRE